jgi:ring-1,2-phenylacetyl-CoA epoxidase subunit PaaD
MVSASSRGDTATAWELVGSVPDPELPMLTLADLGILRDVRVEAGQVTVWLTPTYSGCPAFAAMRAEVHRRLVAAEYGSIDVLIRLAPPWSSDWITDDGRRKLAAAGIAPPQPVPPRPPGPVPLTLRPPPRRIVCPQCGSDETVLASQFGATACTAMHRCRACGEPFARVKEI